MKTGVWEQVLELSEDGVADKKTPAPHSISEAPGSECFLQVQTLNEHLSGSTKKQELETAPSRRHTDAKQADTQQADTGTEGSEAGAGDDASGEKPIPILLVRGLDMYAYEQKPRTVAGGLITVLALLAALAYTTYQIVDYSHIPPITTSYVEWSDTQGPFPAPIRCTAPNGCWVSNRHNDRWSSHGDDVEATQQGCIFLQAGQEYTMNVTFTQNTLNGLVIVWDPTSWENGTTPGSGVQVMAQTNYPTGPDGILVLGTPVLGGTYLASYVETYNHSAPQPAAKLRREWFVTYVSADKEVLPAATACAANLTSYQLANYTQATIRMMSAWYRVDINPQDVLLGLVGNCGGALQLCLQAGAILLLSYEFLHNTAPHWIRTYVLKRGSMQQQAGGCTSDAGHEALQHVLQQHHVQAGTPVLYVDEANGRHFSFTMLSPAAGAMHDFKAATAAGRNLVGVTVPPASDLQHHQHRRAPARHVLNQVVNSIGRGLSNMSVSGSGGVGSVLRGLSIGGHMTVGGSSSGGVLLEGQAAVRAAGAVRQLPGLVTTASLDGGGATAAAETAAACSRTGLSDRI